MIQSILDSIVELGYISVFNRTLVAAVPPQFNIYTSVIDPVYLDRWNVTIRYLQDYARYHPEFHGDYFLCLYDGWREMTEPVVDDKRVHTQWYSYSDEERSQNFTGYGSVGEPRFHSKLSPEYYVDLPLPVIAYNRHINDRNVLLIPDHEFLETEFRKSVRDVISSDIQWEDKLPQIMWRGSKHINEGYAYVAEGYEQQLAAVGLDRIHPRQLACSITSSAGLLTPDIGSYLNATYDKTPISEMLKYKYLLDLDGMVSAWSGLFWKLFSDSVVFKLHSHWEQWYYRDLVPYVHYIPLRNLSPRVVEEALQWCQVQQAENCRKIALESTKFVRKLTYEYAVKEYIIH